MLLQTESDGTLSISSNCCFPCCRLRDYQRVFCPQSYQIGSFYSSTGLDPAIINRLRVLPQVEFESFLFAGILVGGGILLMCLYAAVIHRGQKFLEEYEYNKLRHMQKIYSSATRVKSPVAETTISRLSKRPSERAAWQMKTWPNSLYSLSNLPD